ncbi:complement component 1 Q subcomponent-binding protein, mitochondrial-like [Diadema antillarum]|uniref:complement component 1 Q subcomponent-binding protein, mitochondrial-like n=1 Tax=Diadema antillarum TaxID=105358 RepID=UPI003A8A50F6
MAFSSTSSRLLANITSRALTQGRQFSVLNSSKKFLLREQHASRTFARSMWNLSSSRRNSTGNLGDGTPGPQANGVGTTTVHWPSKTCSCGCGSRASLHTKADGELVKFLQEEINVEQGSLTDVPKVPDFDVSIDGADITLARQLNGERVVVKFNVNHSVEMEGGALAEQDQQEAAPEMRSYPDFSVEVSKEGTNTLRISCAFQRDEALEDQEPDPEEEEELFLIDEVLFTRGGASTEASEAAYRVGSEVMNGDLYDHLKNYLADRGIDNQFSEKLSDLASAVEHRQYINFLEELNSFLKR